MSGGQNSSFSFHNVSNISAFNVNVTETDDSTESTTWDNRKIARIIHVIVRPTLVVFGTIGNTLSFYIMRRSSLKHLSTCFYMSILALADTGKRVSISIYSPLCSIFKWHVYPIEIKFVSLKYCMFHTHFVANNTKDLLVLISQRMSQGIVRFEGPRSG